MAQSLSSVAGYILKATRQESACLRVRPFTVAIPDRADAVSAVLAAYPDLNAGYQIEAVIGLPQENVDSLGPAPGEIMEGAEEILL